MSGNEENERRVRVANLRETIDRLAEPTADTSLIKAGQEKPLLSPRDIINRRMREMDKDTK